MYKIGIVDDNQIIRLGLEKNITWDDVGCYVTMMASNGIEALELIKNTKPDIIISDVKMPFMDGLEMTEIIHKKYPGIKVIIISAYEEFEYVQKGIKLKVFDYIIKPVDPIILYESVQKAIIELEAEKSIRQKLKKMKPVYEQKFLMGLIDGCYTFSEIKSELSMIELSFEYNSIVVAVIVLDEYQLKNLAAEYIHRERIKLYIIDYIRKIVDDDKRMNSFIFDYKINEIVVILASNILFTDLEEKVFEVMNQLRLYVAKVLETTISVGIGQVKHSIMEISLSYQECIHALAFRHVFGENQVICFKDTGFARDNMNYNKTVWSNEFINKVKMGLEQQSISEVTDIEKYFLKERFSLEYASIAAIEFCLRLFRQYENWGGYDSIDTFGMLYDYIAEVQKCITVSEVFEAVRQLIINICSILYRKRGSHQEKIIETAIKYIETCYMDVGFSLNELAAKVYLTPVYLSLLIKQVKGVNFTYILLSTRMEQAKKLLRSTNMKIYEIAEKIGYSDPNYFSVCFKKYSGYTTSEFRSIK